MAMQDTQLQPGTSLIVQALRADGTCYRWWSATIERRFAACIVTMAPMATPVQAMSGDWIQQHHIRTFYWLDRPYNLLEVYREDGTLEEVYVNVASRPQLEGLRLWYIDHELDVVMRAGEVPQIVDQEEFAEAIIRYGYSPEFQNACWAAAAEAVEMVRDWRAHGV